MGPFLFFYAALTGFLAFAAIYHFVLWWSSRRETLLVVFRADCCIRAAYSAVRVVIATSTTLEGVLSVLRARSALGLLVMVT